MRALAKEALADFPKGLERLEAARADLHDAASDLQKFDKAVQEKVPTPRLFRILFGTGRER